MINKEGLEDKKPSIALAIFVRRASAALQGITFSFIPCAGYQITQFFYNRLSKHVRRGYLLDYIVVTIQYSCLERILH